MHSTDSYFRAPEVRSNIDHTTETLSVEEAFAIWVAAEAEVTKATGAFVRGVLTSERTQELARQDRLDAEVRERQDQLDAEVREVDEARWTTRFFKWLGG